MPECCQEGVYEQGKLETSDMATLSVQASRDNRKSDSYISSHVTELHFCH